MTPILSSLELQSTTHIECRHVERFGVIGYHRARSSVAFDCIGQGKVRGEDDKWEVVQTSDAVSQC